MTNKGDNEMMPAEIWARRTPYHTIDARWKFPTVDHSGVEHELVKYTLTVTIADKDKIIEALHQSSKSQTQTAEALIKKCRARDKTIKKLEGVIEKYKYAWDLMRIGHPDAAGLMHKALSDNATQIKEAKDNA